MIINHRVIDGNRADHGRTFRRQLPAETSGVAIGTEIHNSLRSHSTAERTFSYSMSTSFQSRETPRFTLIFVFSFASTPLGLKLLWFLLHGMIASPFAISSLSASAS